MIGEAKLEPTSLADIDRHKSEDMKRPSAAVLQIEEVIVAPGMVHLEEESHEPTQKRVSMTEEQLRSKVIRLFKQVKDEWKVDEIAQQLDHPKEPIARLLKQIGQLDPYRKHFTLQDGYK